MIVFGVWFYKYFAPMALGIDRTSAERSAEFECNWFYLV